MSITKTMLLNGNCSIKKKIAKIRIIFDIENWLWQSKFCNFWQHLLNRTQDLKIFIGLVIGLEHKGRPCKMCNSVRQSWVILTVLSVSPTTAALKCGQQPSRNKTQSLPGQFLASLRYHRVSIESGSKAWMHFLIFFFTVLPLSTCLSC